MDKKIIILTPAEILLLETEGRIKAMKIENLQRLAQEAQVEYNRVVKRIIEEFHQETPPDNVTIQIDEKTKRPSSIDWDLPSPPTAEIIQIKSDGKN